MAARKLRRKQKSALSGTLNYRPVSGLSFKTKLVEHVVAKQLLEHIHVHNLDNPYQLAYKAGHSTEIALLSIKNEVHCQEVNLLP